MKKNQKKLTFKDENSHFLTKKIHLENGATHHSNHNHLEASVRFIDENNNNPNTDAVRHNTHSPSNDSSRNYQPVKFVTSFSNIKEDD